MTSCAATITTIFSAVRSAPTGSKAKVAMTGLWAGKVPTSWSRRTRKRFLTGDDAGFFADDTFVFATGDEVDTISDFTAGTGILDKIDLTGVVALDTFAQLEALPSQPVLGTTVIDFGRRLKTFKGLMPYEFIRKRWTIEP